MKVLNFGSMNIDYVYKVPHTVARGETVSSLSRETFIGGKGLNQSVAMARAGLDVCHAGAVGQDGKDLVNFLGAAGVNISYVEILENVPTGHTVIQNDLEGDNSILLFSGANRAITPRMVDQVLKDFEQGDLLIFQNEISQLAYLVECAHEKGMTIIFNPSPMDQIIKSLPLEYVDYFFVNEIEAGQLTNLNPMDEKGLIRELPGYFPKARILLTLGARGSYYLEGERVIHQPIYPARVLDTTAAGDTFSGYFIRSIVLGEDIKKGLDLAARAAAITVSRRGAAPSIPFLEEVVDTRDSSQG